MKKNEEHDYDREHHEKVNRMLNNINLSSFKASPEEDFNSIADRFIITDKDRVPLGLKRRGQNSQSDYNLSAHSMRTGTLPEFANAGGKLYFYWFKFGHILVQFAEQKLLNMLLPEKWTSITNGTNFQWMDYRKLSGVRRESIASKVEQGVVFVPPQITTGYTCGHDGFREPVRENLVIIKAIWDLNETSVFLDKEWISSMLPGTSL